jgi:hypothetical protein
MRLTCDRPIAPPFARRTAAHLFRNFLCSDDTPIALSLFKQVPRPSVNEGLGLAEVFWGADTQGMRGRPHVHVSENTKNIPNGAGVGREAPDLLHWGGTSSSRLRYFVRTLFIA